MSFQSAVGFTYTQGFVGQIITEVPHVVTSWRLNGQSALPNAFGYAYTYSSDTVNQAPAHGSANNENIAVVGGTAAFAGILVNPQEFALSGTSAGTLAPTLVLAPYERAQLLSKGQCVVPFSTAVTFGAAIGFDPDTGEVVLASAEGATALNGRVLTTTTGAGPALIELY
jgi:hypothetical protein